ncbi:MAG: hypothetical protein ACYTFW_16770 [Planctomycetota bacterium]|jgi:DNA-directed RNA polymerase subunit RPC12/RpoP
MIKFKCKTCGQEINVPGIQAGKQGKCPKCKNIITVPKVASTGPIAGHSSSGEQEPGSKNSAYDLTLLEVPQKYKFQDQPAGQSSDFEEAIESGQKTEEKAAAKEIESSAQRKLPWILDIFLYPISKSGLTILAIIVVIPLLIRIVVNWLGAFSERFPPVLVLFVPIVIIGYLAQFLLYLYLYWYFCECIRDSAAGGLRAPETLANTPGLGELLLQWLRTLCCFVVFAGPMLIYYRYARQTDTVFWILLSYAVFFFPMGLLAVVMFDSFSGLNPIVVIGSIFSVFLPYCAMIVVFASTGFLIAEKLPDIWGAPVLTLILQCLGIYLLMVVAHLLGWFYHRYEHELNWEV